MLLERETELRALTDVLDGARAGSGAVAVIEGAPGLGKSHLLEAAKDLAGREDMEVLAATGQEIEREFAFGIALQLLESRVAGVDAGERTALLSGAAQLSAPLFEPPPGGRLQRPAFSLIHGLYWLCANLSDRRPTVLAVDDLHWADAPSLRFLLYLAQRIAELHLAVLVTKRPGTHDRHGHLIGQLQLHPASMLIPLRPLSRIGVGEYVRRALFPNAVPEFCEACSEATGGNPLLLRELLLELASRGVEPDVPAVGGIAGLAPRSIAAWVQVRLRSLGEGALELARAASVLGDDSELKHAAALAGLEVDRAARLASAMTEADILADAPRLRFRHPVVRNAVYADVSAADRARAHLHAARLLREEGADAERVAGPLLMAPGEGSRWALDALCEAADRALAEGRPVAAVRYLRRALVEPAPPEARGRVVLQLGRAEALAGEGPAVRHLREALEHAQDPHLRTRVTLDIARTLFAQGRQREAAKTVWSPLQELGQAAGELRAQLQVAYATFARLGLSPMERDMSAFPGGVLEGEADKADEQALLAHLAFEGALLGKPRQQVRDLAHRALARGDLLARETCDGLGPYLAAFALTVAEDLEAAELALTAAVDDARKRGSTPGSATASHFRALVRARQGRLRYAVQDAQHVLDAARHGWGLALPAAHAVIADAMVERGDLPAATTELRRAPLDGPPRAEHSLGGLSNAFLASRGHVHLLRRRGGDALSDFLECGRLQEAVGAHNPSVIPWRSGAALAAAQLHELSEADRLVQEELGLARAFGAPGAIGRALRAVGNIESGDARVEAFAEAAEVLGGSQAALERARALVDHGAALRRSGWRRDARGPLREGLDVAERCGATALAERASTELAAAGARPRRARLTGPEALTARERQVARLAAEGMSNREIAESLFVTIKTVEWHLRHAFDKLHIERREQLPAALSRSTDQSGRS